MSGEDTETLVRGGEGDSEARRWKLVFLGRGQPTPILPARRVGGAL